MKIEDKFTCLELSKKLKKLNVNQESFFYWRPNDLRGEWDGVFIWDFCPIGIKTNGFDHENWYAGFTGDELISILPSRIQIKGNEPFDYFRLRVQKSFIVEEIISEIYIINYYCDTTDIAGENAWIERKLMNNNIWDKKLSDCLAKTLIYLVENNFIEIIKTK